MPDSLDEQMAAIYRRIEKRIPLEGCETEDDIIARLVPEGKKADARLQTLLNRGFQKRLIEMGLIKGWRTESWEAKQYEGNVLLVRRDEKGHFAKGGRIVLPLAEYLRRLKENLIAPLKPKKGQKPLGVGEI